MILCNLLYGILLWGNSCKEYLNKVLRIQKRALRIISNSPYLSASKPLFEKYNVLDVFNLYKKEVAIFMYKYKNKLLPKSLEGMFTSRYDIHRYNTRFNKDYQINIHKIKGLLHTGPHVWNSLPVDIKQSNSLGSFRNKVSSHLLNNLTL